MWTHRVKHFVFDWFALIAGLLVVGLLALTWFLPNSRAENWKLLLTLWGGVLSSLYFISKQKLEETRLFAELFQSFNRRYDKMNEGLNELMENPDRELRPCDKDLLYDYFNLCAEEYLFYKRGYIYQEVWDAWKNGIRHYMSDPRIRELWTEEKRSDSYYDFDY
jgi:hypothetical protein